MKILDKFDRENDDNEFEHVETPFNPIGFILPNGKTVIGHMIPELSGEKHVVITFACYYSFNIRMKRVFMNFMAEPECLIRITFPESMQTSPSRLVTEFWSNTVSSAINNA